jgi:hypothetical protein
MALADVPSEVTEFDRLVAYVLENAENILVVVPIVAKMGLFQVRSNVTIVSPNHIRTSSRARKLLIRRVLHLWHVDGLVDVREKGS